MNRKCNECTLCCRLVPVRDARVGIDKGANEKCRHQSSKGCGVYKTAAMPNCCTLWACRWLVDPDCAALSRPDRSHFVVDIMPDFITARDNETGVENNIQIVQIWVDPKFPNAHRDPALRAYLLKLSSEQGIVALIRYSAEDAFVLVAPSQSGGRGWVEMRTAKATVEHNAADLLKALGGTLKLDFVETGAQP